MRATIARGRRLIAAKARGVDVAGDTHHGTHSYVGDLVIRLKAPDGTVVTLIDRMAGGSNDGNADALTDGLLIVRYLFGLRGSALVANAVSAGATRTSVQIEAYLQSLMP